MAVSSGTIVVIVMVGEDVVVLVGYDPLTTIRVRLTEWELVALLATI